MTAPRLHPQSWTELRQLVKLHGVADLRKALDTIEAEQRKAKPQEKEKTSGQD